MTSAEQTLLRLQKRLEDVTAGKAKLERLIAADPKSNRAIGLRRRLAEYDESMAGLPAQIQQFARKVERQKAAASK